MLRARLVDAVMVGLCLGTLTACNSQPEREYLLPRTLCGLKVPDSLYAPLFRPGSKVDVEQDHAWGGRSEYGSQGCTYFVDGDFAVRISGDWRYSRENSRPTLPLAVLGEEPASKPRKYARTYRTATNLGGAAAVLKCSPSGADGPDRYMLQVSVNAYKFAQDWDEAREPLGKLVQAAMAKVEARLPCKGKKPPA
ncbi:hypothetical protein [Streptomyces sp. NBC_01187]|uniref:hypothetical protein n=1 Tax=Streptomyces sp. NBC_01187 TaxID=2903766 RepID=UPI003866E792|nr:hypothetical protein OG220_07635 [Streptomyces sp. NBC_01187]